jgi:hypothetical protein
MHYDDEFGVIEPGFCKLFTEYKQALHQGRAQWQMACITWDEHELVPKADM